MARSKWQVVLNRPGVGAILKQGEVPAAINALAQSVASRISLPAGEGDVVVESYTTDRGAAAVVVRHPRAVGLQAKYGLITRAAAGAGLTVKTRGGGR